MSLFGRSQLISNALASGLAYFIAVVIGFIMPRFIYESLGSLPLGLWDLGWSLLTYVTFTGIGFGPAISHFISRNQSLSDSQAVSATITTGMLCQLAFALSLTIVFVVGFYLVAFSVDFLDASQVLIVTQIGVLLGVAAGITTLGDFAQNVLIGFHRTKTGEFINIAHDIVLALSMVTVLVMQFGVVELALATLAVRFCFECIRFWIAYRYFHHLPTGLAYLRKDLAGAIMKYAVKTSATVVQELVVYQAARLVLFFSSGPIALAAFSRYTTITRQINRLVDRLSTAIPAIASGFSAAAQVENIRSLYVNGSQAGLMITLPLLSIFAVFGDQIVTVWMGREFVIGNLAWTLAGAALIHAHYSISIRILSGINSHGRIALACLFLSGFSLFVLTSISYPQDAAASALMIAMVMVLTVHIPSAYQASKKLGLSLYQTMLGIYVKPMLMNLIFLAVLVGAANMLAHQRIILGVCTLTAAILLLFVSYWNFLLERRIKRELIEVLRMPFRAGNQIG